MTPHGPFWGLMNIKPKSWDEFNGVDLDNLENIRDLLNDLCYRGLLDSGNYLFMDDDQWCLHYIR